MGVSMFAGSALIALGVFAATAAGAADSGRGESKPNLTLCRRLAAEARRLPPDDWRDSHTALRPSLVIDEPKSELSADAARLAQLPAVKDAIAPEGWTTFSERLPGTDVHMFETIQGTLHCQTHAFVEQRPGTEPRIVDTPKGWDGEGEGLCWTRSGDVGRVFQQPAAIASGALTDRTDDEDISITPWTGVGWGDTCKVKLRFKKVFLKTGQFCGDARVCLAGGKIAVDVAEAYERHRAKDPHDPPFRFGPAQTAEGMAAVLRAKAHFKSPTDTAEFPIFGAGPDQGHPYYSYVDIQLFPVILGGKTYVGSVGHQGLGWRESKITLVALFAEKDGALTPLAGYVVELRNRGLARIDVED